MRLRALVLRACLVTLAVGGSAHAQTATQVVSFQVTAIRQISVTGNPAPMTISTATAGSAPTSATSDGTSYAVTTNETNQKITASLDQAMPAGVSLEVALAPPGGADSPGSVTLGTAGVDVVTGISSTSASGLPITYRLSATPAVQMSAPATRTVTFTIVGGT